MISTASPNGKFSPCDLFIVIYPMCLSEYFSIFACNSPLLFDIFTVENIDVISTDNPNGKVYPCGLFIVIAPMC